MQNSRAVVIYLLAGINFTVSCAECSRAVAIYLFLNLEMLSILVDHDQLDIILLLIATTSSSSAFPAISLGFTILLLFLHSQLYLWGSPFFFFFCVPQLYLWGSPFLVRFLCTWLFFNPTIEVVTFRLHGWCMLGVSFCCRHSPIKDMSVRVFWVHQMECMCAQTRPWFIISSKRVFWEWSQNPCQLQGKNPLY